MDAADPDRDLVERCRSDDADALRELLDRYKDVVYAPIARVTPDVARAESLAQEVFLRIHRSLPYFRGEAPLETWILRTTADVCPAAFDEPAGNRVPLLSSSSGASPQFVIRTLGRLRRERWRREQVLDIAFNVAIGLIGIATAALALYFVDASGIPALSQGAMGTLRLQVAGAARNVAPSLPGYFVAAALIVGVLIAWWWAER